MVRLKRDGHCSERDINQRDLKKSKEKHSFDFTLKKSSGTSDSED